jgi:hypothetical protein
MEAYNAIAFHTQSGTITETGSIIVIGSALPHCPRHSLRLSLDAVTLLPVSSERVLDTEEFPLVSIWRNPNRLPKSMYVNYQLHALAILDFANSLEWDYLWYVHHDMYFAGEWGDFFDLFLASGADFIAPNIQERSGDPESPLWESFCVPQEQGSLPEGLVISAECSIFRVSRYAFDAIRCYLVGRDPAIVYFRLLSQRPG